MAEQKDVLDFASGQQSSNEQLAGAIPQSVNVLVDSFGAVHLRPGVSAWAEFGESPLFDEDTSVDGITTWNGYVVYVTSDRLIHVQMAPTFGVDISDATAVTQLDGVDRPVMCPTRDRVVIAGGGYLQQWDGPASALSSQLSTAPKATHVVANSQRLIVNPVGVSGQIQWSDPGDYNTWTGEFKELESRPDPLPALYDNTGELIGGGTETVQTLAPDPAEIYTNVRTWQSGFGAPYSFAQNDETFGFLDSKQRIQLSNGRSYQPISDPALTGTLAGMATTSDCIGYRFKVGSWDILAWNFPSTGRMFVYDTSLKAWGEWRGFPGKSHHYWSDRKLNLVGLGDGTIGLLDHRSATDSGTPIVAECYTGFSDHGVDNYKQHVSTRFMFRRGLAAVGTAPLPRCQLFWRDAEGAWEDPYELSMGDESDPNPVVEVRSLGTFRTRQWRLRMSDSTVPFALIKATITFEVLEV